MANGTDPIETDLVVVGAGLAGLAAAATAALAGHRVTILESRAPGGRAAVSVVDPGVVFNAGPRALYNGGAGRSVLRELGVEPVGGSPATDDAYGARDGQVHRLPAGAMTMLRTPLLGWRSKVAVGRALAGLQRVDTASLGHVSIRRWMQDRALAPDAVDLFRTVLRTATYCDDIEDFSADAAIGQVQLALGSGVMYPDGGFQQFVDGLRRIAVTAGVRLVDHDPVRTIEAAHTRGWTVSTGTSAISARAVVVATGGPDSVERLVPARIDRSGLGPPVSSACLELAVTRPPRHSLLLGIGEPIYLSRHTPAAGHLAPDGITVVHVVRYGARSSDEDRRDLWRHAKLAGLSVDDVVAERFLHKMVVAGGLPIASAGGLAGRPTVRVTGVEGMFIAGDWVGPVGLLADAALASGRSAGLHAVDLLASVPLVSR